MDKKKSFYEIKYINEKYNQFNKDIIDILKNSKYQNNNRLYPNYYYGNSYNFNFNKKRLLKNLMLQKYQLKVNQK